MTALVAERNEGITVRTVSGPYQLVRPAGSEYGVVTYADSLEDSDAWDELCAIAPGLAEATFEGDFPFALAVDGHGSIEETVHCEIFAF